MLVLKFYVNISGLVINTEKKQVVWFGSLKDSIETLCPEYNLDRNNKTFTLLGVKFSTDLNEIGNLNYDAKIEEIKKLFANWSKTIISPIGKLMVIKTIALSKLNHLIMSIPNPPLEKINLIQNLFSNTYTYRDKVKRNFGSQEYKLGGLKMVDIKCFMNSLRPHGLGD